jgi:hypothetical protein
MRRYVDMTVGGYSPSLYKGIIAAGQAAQMEDVVTIAKGALMGRRSVSFTSVEASSAPFDARIHSFVRLQPRSDARPGSPCRTWRPTPRPHTSGLTMTIDTWPRSVQLRGYAIALPAWPEAVLSLAV